MKKTLLVYALIWSVTYPVIAQTELKGACTIKVSYNNPQKATGTIYLDYQLPMEKTKKDSAKIINGIAQFKMVLKEPSLAMISLSRVNNLNYLDNYLEKGDVFAFFIQPGIITIRTSSKLAASTTVNATLQKDYLAVKEKEDACYRNIALASAEKDKLMALNDTASAIKKLNEISTIKQGLVAFYKSFCLTHLQSPVSVYALEKYFSYGRDLYDPTDTRRTNTADSLYHLMPVPIKTLPSATALKNQFNLLKNIQIGSLAPNFTAADAAGKLHSMYALRGKYVLIDFWASWCAPCRAQFPLLKTLYSTFSKKNFEIIGVALDNKTRWMEALKVEKTPWLQVLDDNSKNSVSELYHISPIPMNYLIDPDGKVIAINLSPEELKTKLKLLIP